MAKTWEKRSIHDCAKIGLMVASGVEYDNMGYCDDLMYYQGDESVFKAQQIAKNMSKEKGDALVKFIIQSNKSKNID